MRASTRSGDIPVAVIIARSAKSQNRAEEIGRCALWGQRQECRRSLASRARAALFALLTVQAFAAPNLEKLAEQLASSERDQRRDAAHQAATLGAGAKALLPQLITALDDSDSQVFSDSAAAIAELGPSAKSAIPKLLDLMDGRKGRGFRPSDRGQAMLRAAYALSKVGVASDLLAGLKSDDTSLRRGCAKALGFIGADAKDAIPALIENLGHDDRALRADMVEALALIGPASVEPLISSLGWPDARVREGSARALGELHAGGEPLLRAAADEKETPVLAAILGALPRSGAAQEKSVPVLISALCDSRDEIHRAAVNAIVLLRPAAPVAVPALMQLLDGPNAERAAEMLGFIGTDASAAVSSLLTAAKRTTPPGKAFAEALSRLGAPAVPKLIAELAALPPAELSEDHWAVLALGRIGGAAVPALEKELAAASPAVRLAAVKVLGAQGSGARSVQARVLGLSADPEPLVRATVLSVLEPLGVPTGRMIEFISQLIKDPEPKVRRAAAEAAGTMGKSANSLAKDLSRLLEDKDGSVCIAAIKALGAIGTGLDTANLLAAHLSDAAMRPAVLEALEKLGPTAESAIPKLVAIYPDATPDIRVQILQIFDSAAKQPGVVLPVIYPALSAPEETIRSAAVGAYAKLQPDKGAAIAATIAALKDPARTVREAAAVTIVRLGENGNERAFPAIPVLQEIIQRESDHNYALDALRGLRVKDPEAIRRAFEFPHDEVRQWAAERVGRLGRDGGKAFMPELEKLTTSSNYELSSYARRVISQLTR